MKEDLKVVLQQAGVDAELREAAVQALETWFPGAEFVISPLSGGRSEAVVLRLDVRATARADDAGVFVFKVAVAETETAEREPGEVRAHSVAQDFASRHVPRVANTWTGRTGDGRRSVAVLYDIAGGSLRRYTVASRRGSMPLLTGLPTIISETSSAWCRPQSVATLTPVGVLEHVVGSAKLEQSLALASDAFGPQQLLYDGGHVFLSPGALFEVGDELPFVAAFQHGDFHSGNLVVPVEPEGHESNFWVIDFEKARDSFFGLDLAYLEISVLLDFWADVTGSALARCLEYAEFPERHFQVPDDHLWLASFMRTGREAIREHVALPVGRQDDIERQILVARIIEAVRWSQRFHGRQKGRLALAYAGWYTAEYQKRYPDSLIGRRLDAPRGVSSDGELSAIDEPIWDALWQDTGRFARSDWTYVLACDRLPREAAMASLGALPWAAVIDLDADSDLDGLYCAAGPVLSASRAIHVFSDTVPPLDPRRGTAWLMSGGWHLRRESHLDFQSWFRSRYRYVRTLMESLRRGIGDRHVVLVVVPNQRPAADADAEQDRLIRVIESFDETFAELGHVAVVGDSELRTIVQKSDYPLAPKKFLAQLAAAFGAESSATHYRLPSVDGGSVSIAPESLQILQESLDVLHDRVLAERSEHEATNDAFWRGGQVAWADLAEELDVPRAVGSGLVTALSSSLTEHRTHTVVLQHTPGAGGTTTALRAAWNLHWQFPTAVLRPGRGMTARRLALVADRLQRLYVLTNMPVLFVAEGSDLAENDREELHRELSRRNTRVTTLYVRRTLAPAEHHLAVSDPLDDGEARLFLARYRQLTDDPDRLTELDLLVSDAYAQYRSPFFFGLITYQREFEKIEEFVQHHLRDVVGRARDVLSHLSLVSLYTNSGLQLGVLQRLFRLSGDPTLLDINDLLGPAAPLVVQRAGRYRIAHQLLAEEVLRRLSGDRWKLHLNDLALDLIDDVAAVAETASEPIALLFRQLFIDRVTATIDGAEDRGNFAPLIADLDIIDPSVGHQILERLVQVAPEEAHFWNHLGRHQVYRLQRDLNLAEDHLGKAIALSPGDSVHHHTLGLARRARMRQGLRTAREQGLEALMDVVDAWFYRTVESFERARELSPDDIYNYITHVQTILEVARALRTAARVSSVADLGASAGEWVLEHLTIANTLLDDALQIYGTLERQDDYLQQCIAEIQRLYGDLDAVVRVWELSQASGQTSPFARRALAQAYLVRAQRSWRLLTSTELTRIASLAEENLRRQTGREEDYRLWFEAQKLLPHFDSEHSLAHLELWSARLPSWRAAFYTYVLRFLLWLTERSDDVDAMDSAQEQCLNLARGRTNHAYSWLAKDPSWCPIVADSDLGEWDRRSRFWTDTSLLQRVNGVIDLIDGPTSGVISLSGRRVRAFFVPVAGGFSEGADENTPVNFFLGFSPAGLRAWGVQRGHDEQAITRGAWSSEVPDMVSRPQGRNYEEHQQQRLAALQFTRMRSFVQALVGAVGARGASVSVRWLEERVAAMFGVESLEGVRRQAVRAAVDSLPELVVQGVGGDAEVRPRREPKKPADDLGRLPEHGFLLHLNPEERSGLIVAGGDQIRFSFEDVLNPNALAQVHRNNVVRFQRDRQRRHDVAVRVEVLSDRATLARGRVVDEADLPRLVSAELRRLLEDALASDMHRLPMAQIEDALEGTFRGGLRLNHRVGASSLRAFIRSLSWVHVAGSAGAQTVALRGDTIFGRAQPAREPVSVPETSSSPAATSRPNRADSTVIRDVIAQLQREKGEARLTDLGDRLRHAIGEEAYALFKGASLARALSGSGFEVVQLSPVKHVVRASSDLGNAAFGSAPTDVDGSVDAELNRLLNELQASGEECILQTVRKRLVQVLGQEAYDQFAKPSLKKALDRLVKWRCVETRPGVWVLERAA